MNNFENIAWCLKEPYVCSKNKLLQMKNLKLKTRIKVKITPQATATIVN